jgi:hypothetical protein
MPVFRPDYSISFSIIYEIKKNSGYRICVMCFSTPEKNDQRLKFLCLWGIKYKAMGSKYKEHQCKNLHIPCIVASVQSS